MNWGSHGLLFLPRFLDFERADHDVEAALLAFSLALVQTLGIVGVALGTLIGSFITRVVVQPIWGCRALSIPYGEYVYTMARTLLRCMLVLALPTFMALEFAEASYARLVVVGAASAAIEYFPTSPLNPGGRPRAGKSSTSSVGRFEGATAVS